MTDLMPRHPIYLDLLPPAVRDAIGRPHAAAVPAMRLLRAEGFAPAREVDIFDAGPILECATAAIRSVREARRRRVGRPTAPPGDGATAIVAIPEPDPLPRRALPGGRRRRRGRGARSRRRRAARRRARRGGPGGGGRPWLSWSRATRRPGRSCGAARRPRRLTCDRAMAAARAAFPAWSRARPGRARRGRPGLRRPPPAPGPGSWRRRSRRRSASPRGRRSPRPSWSRPRSRSRSRRSPPGARPSPAGPAVTRFRPHGVCVVLGPYNYPAHLPNGHVAPGAAGGQLRRPEAERARALGRRADGRALGGGRPARRGHWRSCRAGGRSRRPCSTTPSSTACSSPAAPRPAPRCTAASPGGRTASSPWRWAATTRWSCTRRPTDTVAAAYLTVRSAYLTAGQRCTCARRLIVTAGPAGERVLDDLAAMTGRSRAGPPSDRPEPFMGPVIARGRARRVLDAQAGLLAARRPGPGARRAPCAPAPACCRRA